MDLGGVVRRQRLPAPGRPSLLRRTGDLRRKVTLTPGRRRRAGSWLRRHRAAIASYVALALAVSALVVYAVAATGFRAHQTQLNDGGIWVTDNADSAYGRMNKPIGQLDGAIFAGLNANLDIVQDGSAVVGVDLSGGTIEPLDPSTMQAPPNSKVAIPADPEVEEDGGTVAVADQAAGTVWATRVDPVAGLPDLTAVARDSKPVMRAGKAAALAVSESGTVYAVSAAADKVLSVAPQQGTPTGFGAVHAQPLAVTGTTRSIGLTTVGETPVAMDSSSGRLWVAGGATTTVPKGSVLQQPGPTAGSVLVDTPTALVSVDLGSGAQTTLARQVRGRPAAPVRLGSCSYGAWSGGTGFVATVCDGSDPMVAGLRTQTRDLVFRVNRGQIVLNDRGTGAVWNVDRQEPERLDNWDAFQTKPTKASHHQKNDNPALGDRQPPKAKDDSFGARPGRSTVLYPLDNDSAPKGRLLAIRSIQSVSNPKASWHISPDGQTVAFTLPAGSTDTTSFVYYVDDGRDGVSAHATVRVRPRPLPENAPPELRPGTRSRIWNVPAGGVLSVPVLSDWRDYTDGDALSLVSATPESGTDDGAAATVTDAGAVRFRAPDAGGIYRVRYGVTDGIGATQEKELEFRVEKQSGDVSYPAVAEPDVVVGQTGQPITIKPLLNDLPGSDPLAPDAELTLAGRVAQPAGAQVSTNLNKGTITLRSATAHTYFLDYQAAYGNAKAATGRIRVDVRDPKPLDPVTMPDQVTIHGDSPSLVDVLANDYDPGGGLLAVQSAQAADPTQLDVGVVNGRWLRISAPQGALTPDPQVVTYQVSDGQRSGISGQVVVDWRPDPADPSPVTNDDQATVRAGNAIAVPVLDNDFSPVGDQLTLVTSVDGQKPGRLQVGNEGGGPAGSAYVVGRQVRYVAPAKVSDTENVQVSYVAADAEGRTAAGTLDVTVVPRSKADDPPDPPELDGRVVSGDQVKLRLPGSGVDPDGDAVTIEGLDTAPSLGRIVKIGANSIDYQAYPGSVGTDDFSYDVTDSEGATATGTVRVVITPPETPQPPQAVDDTMSVAPGRVASVDVLANDLVSSGDRVTVSLVDPPSGVSLGSPTGPVRIQAPRTADGHDVVVVYRISNGLDVSQATVTLHVVPGYDNPPVVPDAFGSTGNGDTVTTDVLATAYDPDGPASGMRISKVMTPKGVKASVVDGSKIKVSRGKDPIVVPFVVTDRDGAATTANLYVPAASGGAPYVKPGALIRLKPDGSFSGKLSSFVASPSGRPVRFTATNRVFSSPRPGVDIAADTDTTFHVDAEKQYAGPGAVVFEVTTATGRNAQGAKAHAVVLTVPVQVGEDKPILRCPANSLSVAQSESLTVDILALCHVWTIDPSQQSSLTYHAAWSGSAAGLHLGALTGAKVQVTAGANARPGSTAVLDVSASGSNEGQIRIRVTKSAPPRLSPIHISDLRYGETRTIDLARYLIAGVKDPDPVVVSATETSGVPVRITSSGTSVTLKVLKHVHGHATFRIVMSDAGRDAGPERRVQGVLSLDILDVPDAPGKPLPDGHVHSGFAPISFAAAQANGSPVTGYQVRSTNGDRTASCGSTSCTVTGLHNGTTYHFQVRARNAIGWGPWSPASRPYTPYARAGQVRAVRMTDRGDHYISIAWDRPPTNGLGVLVYKITWPGAGTVKKVTSEHATITGLNNDDAYRFTIVPVNQVGTGVSYQSRPFRPIGTPASPGKPTITDIPQQGDTAQVSISWGAVDANGPPGVRYNVYRDGQVVCSLVQATTCSDQGMPYDGRTYTYTVSAINQHGTGLGSAPGIGGTYQAVGTPAPWGNDWTAAPTGVNQQVQVSYTVPASRGAQSRVDILVDGSVNTSFTETGAVSHKITVPSNGQAYNISLRVCNEFNRCTTTAGVQSVQAYGPLSDASISGVSWGPNGTSVTYQITGSTNGRPATLTLTGDRGSSQTWNLPTGAFSVSYTSGNLGYDGTENITVSISDPQVSRGSGTAHVQGKAGDPPTAGVSVVKGPACSDDSSTGKPACNNTGNGFLDCTDGSCTYVGLNLSSFVNADGSAASVTCVVTGGHTGLGGNTYSGLSNGGPYVLSGSGSSPSASAQSGQTVTATCQDGFGQTATGQLTW